MSSRNRLSAVKCCDYCYKISRKDENGFSSNKHRLWFCNTSCYYVFLLTVGEIDRSNSVLFNSVAQLKETHYPYSMIKKNKDKMEFYENTVFTYIKPKFSGDDRVADNVSVASEILVADV